MKPAYCKHLVALYEKIRPELPARRAHDTTPPIGKPEVGVAPSERKKMEEQKRQQQQQKVVVQPVSISAPKNTNRSAKAGRKQSTMPRSVQNPVKKTQASVQPPLKNTVARRKR